MARNKIYYLKQNLLNMDMVYKAAIKLKGNECVSRWISRHQPQLIIIKSIKQKNNKLNKKQDCNRKVMNKRVIICMWTLLLWTHFTLHTCEHTRNKEGYIY